MPKHRRGKGYRLFLTKKEKLAVKTVIRRAGLNYTQVAEALGKSRRTMQYWLNGNMPIRYNDAAMLYLLVGKNPKVAFLITRPGVNESYHSLSELDNSSYRRRLFRSYSGSLEAIFMQLPESKKGEMLKDLSKVAKKYTPQAYTA